MFLLIEIREKQDPEETNFNTSHVSINQESRGIIFEHVSISIHLMFLLITVTKYWQNCWCGISIHLMFLLIPDTSQRRFSPFYFNTSHVSINRKEESKMLIKCHFNTSHVSINLCSHFRHPAQSAFQYISCFY